MEVWQWIPICLFYLVRLSRRKLGPAPKKLVKPHARQGSQYEDDRPRTNRDAVPEARNSCVKAPLFGIDYLSEVIDRCSQEFTLFL